MRAAAVQLKSREDTDRNLATADRLARSPVSLGAELLVRPRLGVELMACGWAL